MKKETLKNYINKNKISWKDQIISIKKMNKETLNEKRK